MAPSKSQLSDISIDFNYVHPYEGAYLLEKFLTKVLNKKLTWVPTIIQTMFGEQEEAPVIKDLEVAPEVTETFTWGSFTLDNIKGTLRTKYKTQPLSFVLEGEIDARQKTWITDICEQFKEYLVTHSLYKNRAVILEDLGRNSFFVPKFINTAKINANEYILNEDIKEQINTSIDTLITNYTNCKEYNIPIKRGILLHGPYGTGKTLVARQTAKTAVDSNWTFFLIKRATDLAEGFKYAQRFSPCVLFVEDIDTAFNSAYRDVSTNDFLNTFDNIYSKSNETVFIMTTNHPAQLSKPMLRPGRIDSIIEFELPNSTSIEKLIRHYGKNLIKSTTNIKTISEALIGISPAVLRELIERAKLESLAASGSAMFVLDLLPVLYKQMQNHLTLIENSRDLGVKKDAPTLEEKIDAILSRLNGY